MGAALNVNTILGMLDLGISWQDYSKFDGKGSAPDSSDWIIYDTGKWDMAFVPKSAPSNAKNASHYGEDKPDNEGTCGVYYRGVNEKERKTPMVKVFTKGC